MRKFSLITITVFIAFFVSMSFNNHSETVYGENSKIAVGKVTASALNVRSDPKQNSRRIGILLEGTTVHIVEIGVNKDWYKIKFNNQWGYVHGNFVTITQNNLNSASNLGVGKGKVTASTLNVRAEPNQNSRRVSVLHSGTTIDIYEVGVNKDWLKIKINNDWGYVHGDFVTVTKNKNTATPAPTNQVVGKGEVTVNALNVRAEANQSARRVTVLSQGTSIDIYEVGVNKDWLKIKVNNDWAYVHGDFVTVTKNTNTDTPAPTNQVVGKGEVTVNALNVRAEANQAARRVTVLPQGTSIDIYEVGVNKDWLKIKVNNDWAYVHGDFVTVTKNTNTDTPAPTNQVVGKGEVTVNALNVRAEANQSARRITVLPYGASLEIYEVGVNKDWLKIKVSNEWGYVHSNFVNLIGSPVKVDTKKLENKVIALDPGHGGRDPGAVAFGLKEKDLVLDMSLILQTKLQQAGAKVYMTRTEDVFISLGDRVQAVKKENADIFLSVHVNSASLASVHGTETFWNRNFEKYNSHLLASSLQTKLVDNLGTRNRGVKEAGFEIIKYTQVPSVLIELGFLTNYDEAQRLASHQFQEQTAQAIVDGLVDYYNNN